MNAVTEAIAFDTISQEAADALLIGAPVGGGFYAGLIRQDDGVYVLAVAPKDGGEHDDIAWNDTTAAVAGAGSCFDGRANTIAMAEAGSALAKWALGLQINGSHDWYLPARDELEVIYRNLKPTSGNLVSFRDGDNASSLPPGYPYSRDLPAQTSAEHFHEGGLEAFEEAWYWASTQAASGSDFAWYQAFSTGHQCYYRKHLELRARAVRRLKIQ
ncbi:DUF1566 domain-containing protein [Ralstonia sp.]|uniref:Lcl domain-containing protein n=1 Tax=Ralstonia sp. TaxID=54061 RepID=UPI001A3C7859|nr:DUF1566 domain-containing protein [Ralstonia sp.]MBL4778437.1 DUF1566 domain-containing protein [Ralstonia sp.]